MMRGPSNWAVAVRKPDGQIAEVCRPIESVDEAALGLPAADRPRRDRARRVARDRLPRARRSPRTTRRRRRTSEEVRDRALARRSSSSPSRSRSASRSRSSRSAPALIADLAPDHTTGTWFVIVEGLIRVADLRRSTWSLISLLPDLRRVFQYHAAEHKAINAYEAGEELTPETVQRYSLIHPRCGTAFLLWVMVIAIFVFAFFGRPALVLADRDADPAAAGDRRARLRADPLRRQAHGQPGR